MLTAWLLYIGTGAVAGILAGLLGIGGGLVIVPILNIAFTAQGLPADYIQHLALGTSLATIIFTSISSMRAHHKRGSLLWPVFKAITPGILIGSFLGSKVASLLSSRFLSAFFVVFLYYVATQMLLNIKPKATREVPGTLGMATRLELGANTPPPNARQPVNTGCMRAHHKRGSLLWPVFKAITPGILIGSFLGSKVASLLSSRFLSAFFVAFLYYVATQMLLNIKPKATREVPGPLGMLGAGGVIGCVSSLVGIGGGTMTVPFLTWCNVGMLGCIGTSAAVGLPIALASTVGYIYTGLQTNLPGISGGYLGFIYLPAFFGVVAASILTAPLGAKMAHNMPISKLKKIFACLLVVVATRMLWALVAHYFV